MPYITKSNANKMISELRINELPKDFNFYTTKIHFFNELEAKMLYAFKQFIENPEEVCNQYYNPINIEDTETLLYEGKKPAYHSSPDCELIANDFDNMRFPKQIKELGVTIEDFRDFFKNNLTGLLEKKYYDQIKLRLRNEFGVDVNQADFINLSNSDNTEFKDFKLEDLERSIDSLLDFNRKYQFDYPNVFPKFQKRTFLYKKFDEIDPDGLTGYSDSELKELFMEFEDKVKRPVSDLLKEWYRIKFNPDFKFSGSLLKSLNFKPCSKCYKKGYNSNSEEKKKKKKDSFSDFEDMESLISEPKNRYECFTVHIQKKPNSANYFTQLRVTDFSTDEIEEYWVETTNKLVKNEVVEGFDLKDFEIRIAESEGRKYKWLVPL